MRKTAVLVSVVMAIAAVLALVSCRLHIQSNRGGVHRPYNRPGTHRPTTHRMSSRRHIALGGSVEVKFSRKPPPRAPSYSRPRTPGRGHVWTPGYFVLDSRGEFTWVRGRWTRERRGRRWVNPRWRSVGGNWRWDPGGWQ